MAVRTVPSIFYFIGGILMLSIFTQVTGEQRCVCMVDQDGSFFNFDLLKFKLPLPCTYRMTRLRTHTGCDMKVNLVMSQGDDATKPAAMTYLVSDGSRMTSGAISTRGVGTPTGQNELKERVRMAMLLLYKGAYPDLCNKRGKDAIEGCLYSGVRDHIKAFMQQNPQVIKKSGRPGTAVGRGGGGGSPSAGGLDALFRMMTLPCAAATCTKMADITLMPCGHKPFCRNCCLNFSECPICQKPIERRLHKRGDVDTDLADACKQM